MCDLQSCISYSGTRPDSTFTKNIDSSQPKVLLKLINDSQKQLINGLSNCSSLFMGTCQASLRERETDRQMHPVGPADGVR